MENAKKIKFILTIIIFSLITFTLGLLCCDVIAGNNIIEGATQLTYPKTSEPKSVPFNNNEPIAVSKNNSSSNPIDKYFDSKYDSALSTYELVEISDNHYTAWKNEFENIVSLLKEKYPFAEDQEYFDNYLKNYEKLATLSSEIEYLNWVDTSIPQKERLAGTGASYSSIGSMVKIYKQGCLNLIDIYQNSNQEKPVEYTYIFNSQNI